jgi:integrase
MSYREPEEGIATLELPFDHSELASYTEFRKTGSHENHASGSIGRHVRSGSQLKAQSARRGLITFAKRLFAKYASEWSKGKVLTFAAAFLKYLAKTHLDPRYRVFDLFLDRPRNVKVRKNVTSRIVTKEDVEGVIAYIWNAHNNGELGRARAKLYTAFTIFGAFTGQRCMATMMKLTAGQFRESLPAEKPVLRVESHQDKIRMEHYVPLHPQLIQAIKPQVGYRNDDEHFFEYNSPRLRCG